MTKTEVERVPGELSNGGKSYGIQLKLTIKVLHVDERTTPVGRAIAKCELVPTRGLAIPDGQYVLRYIFDGKQEQHSVRVEHGMLLAGG